MTTLDNLRTRKLQLEQQSKENPNAEQREWIEGELTKIDIALSLLDDLPKDLWRFWPPIDVSVRFRIFAPIPLAPF